MPKKRTQKEYFGEAQEKAVIRFLESESEYDRNKIFNEYLRAPLIIMVESIIRRYKLLIVSIFLSCLKEFVMKTPKISPNNGTPNDPEIK